MRWKIRAAMAPLILCQTLKIAPGMMAIGYAAKCSVASDEASPEFCMPTSIQSAFRFAQGSRSRNPMR